MGLLFRCGGPGPVWAFEGYTEIIGTGSATGDYRAAGKKMGSLNFSNGWKADIRSSRLNAASAPKRDRGATM
jgi:hypothetical protein